MVKAPGDHCLRRLVCYPRANLMNNSELCLFLLIDLNVQCMPYGIVCRTAEMRKELQAKMDQLFEAGCEERAVFF